jgi:hypothetical protein
MGLGGGRGGFLRGLREDGIDGIGYGDGGFGAGATGVITLL